MSSPTELAERSMELLARAHSEIVENLPDGWTDSPDDTAGLFQTALFAECMSFSLAIRECLSERLVGPANALGRTLTDLVMMLVYMAHDPSRAQQLTIQYWWKETNREIELTKRASALHGIDITERLNSLNGLLERLRARADELGMTKIKKPPDTASLAKAIGANEQTTKHALSILSGSVHPGLSALSRRLVSDEAGNRITPREDNPAELVKTATLAAVAMADGAAAVARLQDWETAQNLGDLSDRVSDEAHNLSSAASDEAPT